jgi:hypothetical protein
VPRNSLRLPVVVPQASPVSKWRPSSSSAPSGACKLVARRLSDEAPLRSRDFSSPCEITCRATPLRLPTKEAGATLRTVTSSRAPRLKVSTRWSRLTRTFVTSRTCRVVDLTWAELPDGMNYCQIGQGRERSSKIVS